MASARESCDRVPLEAVAEALATIASKIAPNLKIVAMCLIPLPAVFRSGYYRQLGHRRHRADVPDDAMVHMSCGSNMLLYKVKMKDLIIATVLGIIMTLNSLDVITDIGLGVPRWHIVEESMIVLASGLGFLYLLWEMRRRTRQMGELTRTLRQADEQIKNITGEMSRARHRYSEAVQQQFQEWDLTLSEQQVAMLLLKGLSFKEIAVVRDTREKTVRQQASAIYGKTGLEGRHAFSAWFLEDFLAEESGPG